MHEFDSTFGARHVKHYDDPGPVAGPRPGPDGEPRGGLRPDAMSGGKLRRSILRLLSRGSATAASLEERMDERHAGNERRGERIAKRLADMESEGLVTGNGDGEMRTFSLTEAGRAEFDGATDHGEERQKSDGLDNPAEDSDIPEIREAMQALRQALKDRRAGNLESGERAAIAEALRSATRSIQQL